MSGWEYIDGEWEDVWAEERVREWLDWLWGTGE